MSFDSEVAELGVDPSALLPDARSLPPEKEEAFVAMLRLLLRMM